jgi:hypothetical protein
MVTRSARMIRIDAVGLATEPVDMRSGAAAAMSLIQSAKINGLDPYAYLKDILERLPTQLYARIDELLPNCWKPTQY